MRNSPGITVGLLLIWQVSASVCYYAVYAATPFFRDAFGLSAFEIGLVVAALTLGYLLFLLPIGLGIDAVGEYRLLTVGLAGMAVASVVVPLSPTYVVLLGTVFVLGATYAPAIPGTNLGIVRSTPPGRRHLAMGVKQVGVAGGSAISAVLVTTIAGTRFGWEGGFVLAGAIALVVTAAFWLGYDVDRGDGTMELPDLGALLGSRGYLLLLAAGFFLGANLFTTTAYTILYVQDSVGASVAFAGVVLASVQIAGSAGRIVAGWLADLLPGPRRVSTTRILLAQAVGATVAFALVPRVDGSLAALVGFAALGFFVVGFPGIYYSCMSTIVDDEAFGTASAGGQVLLIGGGLLVPPAFGLTVDLVGYDAGWAMLTVSAASATALLALVARRLR